MFDVEDEEELDLHEVRVSDMPMTWVGVSKSGYVYLPGDIHPLGSATALIKAAKEHVPYVAVSAVRVLYPADWLRGECLHDPDRLRIIGNLERIARGGNYKE